MKNVLYYNYLNKCLDQVMININLIINYANKLYKMLKDSIKFKNI